MREQRGAQDQRLYRLVRLVRVVLDGRGQPVEGGRVVAGVEQTCNLRVGRFGQDQVVVRGNYRRTTRRIAAYLGPVPLLPVISSAMATQDSSVSIELSGSA